MMLILGLCHSPLQMEYQVKIEKILFIRQKILVVVTEKTEKSFNGVNKLKSSIKKGDNT